MDPTLSIYTKSEQLKDFLRKEIQKRVYSPNQKVPSERELSERFHVARPTAHKVLSNLVVEGILYRKQGQGTFVSPKTKKERTLSVCIIEPGTRSDFLNLLFSLFELQYPDVTIKASFFRHDEVGTPQFWMRQPDYDLILVEEFMAPFMIAKGILEDLTDLIGSDLKLNELHSTPLSVYAKAGSHYAVPIVASPVMIFCNHQLFDQAGLRIKEDPLTWDEFSLLAKVLTIPEKGQFGFAFSCHRNRWPVILMKRGGCILDEMGSCQINSEVARQTFEWCHSLIYQHRIAPSPMIDDEALFCGGKVAMYLASGYSAAKLIKEADFEFSVIPVPGARIYPTGLIATALGIQKGSPHKELAWEFIAFALSEKPQAELYHIGQAVPARKSSVNDQSPTYSKLIAELPHSKPILSTIEYYEIMAVLHEQLSLLWTNTQPVETVLKEAENKINKIRMASLT